MPAFGSSILNAKAMPRHPRIPSCLFGRLPSVPAQAIIGRSLSKAFRHAPVPSRDHRPPPRHHDPIARATRRLPWDLAQTFATIAPHTIEEAYEVVEAIETGDRAALQDELGDLLFQVVFYAQMAREEGSFDFDDVARPSARRWSAATRMSSATPWSPMPKRRPSSGKPRRPPSATEGRRPAASALDGVSTALPAPDPGAEASGAGRPGRLRLAGSGAGARQDRRGNRAKCGSNWRGYGPGPPGRRNGRSAVRLRQSGPQAQNRPGSCAPARQPEVRATFPPHRKRVWPARGGRPAKSTLDEMEALWAAAKRLE